MKLVEINKDFIQGSFKSIVDAPIKAIKSMDKPIIAIEKWSFDKEGEHLTKKFFFENFQDRNRFVVSILSYELELGHHAKIVLDGKNVMIKLKTLEKNKLAELDKSYSKYADIICKDIAYNPSHD